MNAKHETWCYVGLGTSPHKLCPLAVSINIVKIAFIHAPLGHSAERADSAPPPCQTRERESLARRARWQWKVINKFCLRKFKK